MEVTHYKDEFIKDEILRVLSLPEMNKWKSAQTQAGKAEYEIIFYLNTDKKKGFSKDVILEKYFEVFEEI